MLLLHANVDPLTAGGPYWWLLLSLQEVAAFSAGASLIACTDCLLVAACSSAALARAVAAQVEVGTDILTSRTKPDLRSTNKGVSAI